ncbi:N-formylglutamate amidohydrolase [Alphaproteobacteria bacterium GH1-50]|uniref:N-formylglutamate amidohydrolase n=1 Tax=Kangsaoukella pontilimi TaxID=2691042 RepID=A0A7C9IRD0_9RHOB|nr:N-formylglutamate amidohydrolase [Kangsaoukella pontilimi]MXQ07386.1 N-formylglutamate amidohydrolase [Kangsaoukella pontilimi]
MNEALSPTALLSHDDPDAVEMVNAGSARDVLLVCEHAGNTVPASLGRLGLSDDLFESHIGWDIGAEAVARRMAAALDLPLIIQRYSRLIIDCNRPPGGEGSVPALTGGIPVPGNQRLGQDAFDARRRAVFDPYDAALSRAFLRPRLRAVFSIHSFTPDFPGEHRPWDAGFLSRKDIPTARALIDRISAVEPSLSLALNEPYQIEDATDWLIPRYAEALNMRHCLIEVRNTHITDAAGQERWATLLSDAINAIMETPQ